MTRWNTYPLVLVAVFLTTFFLREIPVLRESLVMSCLAGIIQGLIWGTIWAIYWSRREQA